MLILMRKKRKNIFIVRSNSKKEICKKDKAKQNLTLIE